MAYATINTSTDDLRWSLLLPVAKLYLKTEDPPY